MTKHGQHSFTLENTPTEYQKSWKIQHENTFRNIEHNKLNTNIENNDKYSKAGVYTIKCKDYDNLYRTDGKNYQG